MECNSVAADEENGIYSCEGDLPGNAMKQFIVVRRHQAFPNAYSLVFRSVL